MKRAIRFKFRFSAFDAGSWWDAAENAGDCIIVLIAVFVAIELCQRMRSAWRKNNDCVQIASSFFLQNVCWHTGYAVFRAVFLNRRGHPLDTVHSMYSVILQKYLTRIDICHWSLATCKCPPNCHSEWWPFGCCCRTMFTTAALNRLCVDLSFCEILSSWPKYSEIRESFRNCDNVAARCLYE